MPIRHYLTFAIIFAVLVSAVAGGALLLHFRQRSSIESNIAVAKPVAELSHTRGSADAPVLLEEFGDFECQPCSILWPILEKVEREYGARLSVTFRHHPLPQHRHALLAARASEAAGLQSRFWEMHDSLYRNRSAWVPASDVRPLFESCASSLGSTLIVSERISTERKQRGGLRQTWSAAPSLKIDRTPVIYINGR